QALSRPARAHRGLRQASLVSLTRSRQLGDIGVHDRQSGAQVVLGERFDVLVVERVVQTPASCDILDDFSIAAAIQSFGERLELVARLVLEREVDGRRLAAGYGDL